MRVSRRRRYTPAGGARSKTRPPQNLGHPASQGSQAWRGRRPRRYTPAGGAATMGPATATAAGTPPRTAGSNLGGCAMVARRDGVGDTPIAGLRRWDRLRIVRCNPANSGEQPGGCATATRRAARVTPITGLRAQARSFHASRPGAPPRGFAGHPAHGAPKIRCGAHGQATRHPTNRFTHASRSGLAVGDSSRRSRSRATPLPGCWSAGLGVSPGGWGGDGRPNRPTKVNRAGAR